MTEIDSLIRDSAEKLQYLINHITDVIAEIDLDGTFSYISPQVYDMFGYRPQEIIGKIFFSYIYPDDMPIIIETFEKAIKGKETVSLEYRIRHKEGYYVPVFTKGSLVKINDKLKIVGVVRDITERKEAEEKLRQSDEFFRKLFETMAEGVVLINKEGQIIKANPAAERILGLKRLDIEQRNYISPEWEILRPDGTPMPTNEMAGPRTMKEKHLVENLVMGVKRPDGLISWINVSAAPVIDENGKIVYIVGTFSDITERKKATQKLKESEEKYRNLFETSPSAIVLLDLEGEIIDVNIATESLFGYSKEELIGKKFLNLDIYCNKALQKVSENFNLIVKGEEIHRLEIQLKKKDGSLIWIMIRASLIKIGKEILMQAIMHDITERKIAEQELRKINQLKTELLERTSHELKTPLISIKGFTDLLLDLYREKFDKKTVSILGEIKNGTERLQTLINNLLVSFHLESGKVDFKPLKEDLSFLIRFCVRDLHGLAKTRNHFIHLDIPDKLILRFEKEKIYEVISNLLINAIKYTPPYGEIKIKSEYKNDFVIISVQDNGIGLSVDEKKKIFKQFGKIERYGQGWDIGIEGTGMGLYTSKKIVELHGGEIWVESEGRNKGAKFSFSLPLIKE